MFDVADTSMQTDNIPIDSCEEDLFGNFIYLRRCLVHANLGCLVSV